ncbi:hypothetical protein M23134_06955 [Microscilla marina ATCC 23134]|uniref:Uncharacterized protein n=1 Tax=Microscilla marina ATCC 23134 TaxID=313606 RepID=A1ZYG8_MICM2|nr:hypothetical protein M23134_06955 [Microscilla marina ATCC 23134]
MYPAQKYFRQFCHSASDNRLKIPMNEKLYTVFFVDFLHKFTILTKKYYRKPGLCEKL